MLDYYGSIIMKDKEIDKDILQNFKQYQEKYIQSLVHKLRVDGILTTENSVSGYQIFVRSFIIDNIKHDIEKQYLKNSKKLMFSHYYLKCFKDSDVLYEIIKCYSTIADKSN